jgi:NADPH2:quinone reductase
MRCGRRLHYHLFRRVVVPRCGDASVLQVVPHDVPGIRLAADEVLVRNSFAGLNFIDVYFRNGLYPQPALPFGTGLEGAGAVVKSGGASSESVLGKRVAYMKNVSGSVAGFTVVKAADVFEIPDGVGDEAAASLMLQGCTAHYLTRSCYEVRPGSVVLVHAAAGGTGLLITQMVKALGGTVIGTCGGAAKAELAKSVGRCDVVIDYSATPKWEDEVRRLYPDGVHAVLDGVGKSTFLAGLTVLKPRGSMVTFGNASGPVDPIAPLLLTKYGSISLQRPTLANFSAPGEIDERVRDVFGLVSAGKLTPTIGKVFPLHKAAEAHQHLEGRQSTGKILINCQE